MNPTQNKVHVNRPLTMISVAYMQDQTNFIANQAAPIIPVDHKSDDYYVWEKEDFFRDEAEERAPGTESVGGEHKLGTDTYRCKPYSFHEDVADQDRSNQDEGIDLDQEATELVTHKLLLRREITWLDTYFKPGVWSNELAGVAGVPAGGQFRRWDDYINSDPRVQLKLGQRTIFKVSGRKANTLILSYDAKDALVDHPTFIDRIKYTSRESVTPEMIAKYFDVERVLIAQAIHNKAAKGADADMDFIAGKHALLAYVAPKPGKRTPSAMYTFTWKYAPIAPKEGVRIKKFRMENIESDRVEGTQNWDNKVVAADMGFFFKDCVS
jgi:hypothetical protein